MNGLRSLILGLPPPPPENPPDPAPPPAPEARAASVSPPTTRTPEAFDQFLRERPHIADYLNSGEPFSLLAQDFQSWFVGDDEAHRAARLNYLARDTALVFSFLAFRQATDPAGRQRMADLFIQSLQGYVETLGNTRNLTHRVDGFIRLNLTVRQFINALSSSGLSAEAITNLRNQVTTHLRSLYSQTAEGLNGHAEWSAVRAFALAQSSAQEPPTGRPMGDYIRWVRDMRTNLENARTQALETGLSAELREMARRDLSLLPPLPSETTLARDFIRRATSSFVLLIAKEIDIEAGDSEPTAERRRVALQQAFEEAFNGNEDARQNFSQVLDALRTPEARHLRGLLAENTVLRELIDLDREVSSTGSGDFNPANHMNRWSRRVVSVIGNHSLNGWENFTGDHEQHLSSYSAILHFFQGEGDPPDSLFRRELGNAAGDVSLDPAISREAHTHLLTLTPGYNSDRGVFSLWNGLTHAYGRESWPFILGAVGLNIAARIGLLRLAGESGSLGPLVRGGEITGWGHFTLGTVTGLGLTLGTSGSQLFSDLRAGRPEAWDNFGRNLFHGFLINTVAFGISAGLSAGVRSGFARRGVMAMAKQDQGGLRNFFTRTIWGVGLQAGIGTAGMVGTNAGARWLHNRGRPEEEHVPLWAGDEVAQTFFTMLTMNMAELAAQNVPVRGWIHTQLGTPSSYLRTQLGNLRNRMIENPPDNMSPETARQYHDRIFDELALRALNRVPLRTLRNRAMQDFIWGRVTENPLPVVTSPTPPTTPPTPPTPPVSSSWTVGFAGRAVTVVRETATADILNQHVGADQTVILRFQNENGRVALTAIGPSTPPGTPQGIEIVGRWNAVNRRLTLPAPHGSSEEIVVEIPAPPPPARPPPPEQDQRTPSPDEDSSSPLTSGDATRTLVVPNHPIAVREVLTRIRQELLAAPEGRTHRYAIVELRETSSAIETVGDPYFTDSPVCQENQLVLEFATDVSGQRILRQAGHSLEGFSSDNRTIILGAGTTAPFFPEMLPTPHPQPIPTTPLPPPPETPRSPVTLSAESGRNYLIRDRLPVDASRSLDALFGQPIELESITTGDPNVTVRVTYEVQRQSDIGSTASPIRISFEMNSEQFWRLRPEEGRVVVLVPERSTGGPGSGPSSPPPPPDTPPPGPASSMADAVQTFLQSGTSASRPTPPPASRAAPADGPVCEEPSSSPVPRTGPADEADFSDLNMTTTPPPAPDETVNRPSTDQNQTATDDGMVELDSSLLRSEPPPPPSLDEPFSTSGPRVAESSGSTTLSGMPAALTRALSFFQRLRSFLLSQRLPEDGEIYIHYGIVERGDGPDLRNVGGGRSSTPPSPSSLGPNELVIRVSQNGDNRQIHLEAFERGTLSDETVTALMTRIPSDLTQRQPPQMQQAVQQAERLIVLTQLLETHLRMETAHEMVLPIYWIPEGTFSIEPPPNQSTAPIARIIKEAHGRGFRIRSEMMDGADNVPMEVATTISQALQAILQRHPRRPR